MPFGVASDGRMVSVNDVERGSACNCTCPQCGGALIARKGDINRHHFAHTAEACGGGALETSIHRMAKQIVADATAIFLPEEIANYPENRHGFQRNSVRVQHAGWLHNVTVQTEVSRGDIRPDLVVSGGEGGPEEVAIEIRVAHPVPAEKRHKLQELNLSTIEIDLSGYPRSLTMERLKPFVLREAPRFWLHHSGTAAGREAARIAHYHDLEQQAIAARAAQAAKEEHLRRVREAHRRNQDYERARKAEAERRAEEAEQAAAARGAEVHFLDPTNLEGLIRAALMRPSLVRGPHPTPGAFCGQCKGTHWRRVVGGWGCVACHVQENRSAA